MTRIVVLPADESACGYYRMRLPVGAVSQVRDDWTIEMYRPSDVQLGGGLDGSLWAIHGIPDPQGIDLLVMQRTGTPLQVNLLRWARSQNIATVLDMDDAMWCIDPSNSAHAVWQDKWRNIDAAADVVDCVTVTTPALARRYGKHGRVEIIPNAVPSEVLDLDSIRGDFDPTFTVGWAGFVATHPRDLEVMGDAMRRFVDETGAKVRVIGDAGGAMTAWGLEHIDQVEPLPLGPMYYTALSSLDLAVVPLEPSRFNSAKSYLKALEFAAMGVPVIASRTPANMNLGETVPIGLASTPEQWFEELMYIHSRSAEWKMDRSHFAKEDVREHHTVEGNAHRWIAAWERALSRRARLAV